MIWIKTAIRIENKDIRLYNCRRGARTRQFGEIRGYSAMKTATISELLTAVSSRRAETPTLGRASAEVSSNKSTDFSGWPFLWWTQATTDLLRTWGQFSQLGLQPAAGQRSATGGESHFKSPRMVGASMNPDF